MQRLSGLGHTVHCVLITFVTMNVSGRGNDVRSRTGASGYVYMFNR